MAKFLVLDEVFATKKALVERCRKILYSYKPGGRLIAEHFNFMRDLLERHDSAEQKIGAGVVSMHVQEDGYGRQCFALTRVDGSSTDFSFNACINQKAPDADFRAACRRAIVEQVLAAKDAAFQHATTIICSVSGETIDAGSCHVDHAPPATFLAIYQSFIAECSIDPSMVGIAGNGDNSTEKRIADPTLLSTWQQYHAARANLRVVSARANLSDVKRSK